MRLKLWDEEARRLVPIRELEARARLLEANRRV
jgi:hypothetical protein